MVTRIRKNGNKYPFSVTIRLDESISLITKLIETKYQHGLRIITYTGALCDKDKITDQRNNSFQS